MASPKLVCVEPGKSDMKCAGRQKSHTGPRHALRATDYHHMGSIREVTYPNHTSENCSAAYEQNGLRIRKDERTEKRGATRSHCDSPESALTLVR